MEMLVEVATKDSCYYNRQGIHKKKIFRISKEGKGSIKQPKETGRLLSVVCSGQNCWMQRCLGHIQLIELGSQNL
jgi:hypothetical protein